MAGIAQLNDGLYVQTVSNSSVSIALTAEHQDITKPVAIITNAGIGRIFAVAGDGAAPTAVYPTSSTVPVSGKVILPSQTAAYEFPQGTTHISFIAQAAGSNEVSVSIGSGV